MTALDFPAVGRLSSAGVWRRVLTALVGLAGVVTVAWIVESSWFHRPWGSEESQAAGVAAVVCWLSSGMALVVTFAGALVGRAVAGARGGIVFRTGLPLLAMAMGSQIPWLARNGFPGRVVAYFLVSLAAETILAVWIARRSWNIRFWR